MEHRSLILCGSPRPHGVSARYGRQLEAYLLDQQQSCCKKIVVNRWESALHKVLGCFGCERCRETYECVLSDDMAELMCLLDECDELHVVCPVYFAGPPSKFKAVLDRMQPYWERRIGPHALRFRDARETDSIVPLRCDTQRRPLDIYVIGAGGDPYGYDALVTIISSAFGSAGFQVRAVHDLIGWCQQSEEAFRV